MEQLTNRFFDKNGTMKQSLYSGSPQCANLIIFWYGDNFYKYNQKISKNFLLRFNNIHLPSTQIINWLSHVYRVRYMIFLSEQYLIHQVMEVYHHSPDTKWASDPIWSDLIWIKFWITLIQFLDHSNPILYLDQHGSHSQNFG